MLSTLRLGAQKAEDIGQVAPSLIDEHTRSENTSYVTLRTQCGGRSLGKHAPRWIYKYADQILKRKSWILR